MENVSKEEIAFSLCDEQNSIEGIFRDLLKRDIPLYANVDPLFTANQVFMLT